MTMMTRMVIVTANTYTADTLQMLSIHKGISALQQSY